MKLHQILNEDMGAIPAPDRKIHSPQEFETTIDEFSRRFDAARRALSIVNRLEEGPTKKRHASRVMSQMNVIRNYLNVLMRQLHSMSQ